MSISARKRAIFISYRIEDTGHAASALERELVRVFGEEQIFLDHRKLEGGQLWDESLTAAVRSANVVLALIGPRWLTASDSDGRHRLESEDDWVRRELTLALEVKGRLIPIMVDGAAPITPRDVARISDLVGLPAIQSEKLRRTDWKSDFEKLVTVLQTRGLQRVDEGVPIYLPSVPKSERGKLSFAARAMPFVGREHEQQVIESFLNAEEPFLWLSVSGPAGSGKSRLLLEVCIAARDRWVAGFVDRTVSDFSWREWIPSSPTLLVVDYASTAVSIVREILAAGIRARRRTHPVRVVLLDRVTDDNWENRVLGSGSALYEILSSRFPAAIALEPLRDTAANDLAAEIMRRSGVDGTLTFDADATVASRLPLYVAMAAFAVVDGALPSQWGPPQLMRDWLHRENEMTWRPKGVTSSERRLLCLACLAGPINAQYALSGELTECGIQSGAIDGERYEALSGTVPWSTFDPLVPDILGEFFVLEAFRELHQGNPMASALLQAAWAYNRDQAAGFLVRLAQDFPAHELTPNILGFVPKDDEVEGTTIEAEQLTLASTWSEAASSFLPSTYTFSKPDLAVSLLDTVAGTPLEHSNLSRLRNVYGARLFDDPLSDSGKIMLYAEVAGVTSVWNYGHARNLALRLSDARSRHALNTARMIDQWCERDDTAHVERVLKSAARLLARDGRDRTVRSRLAWALCQGMSFMLGADEIDVALDAWKAIEVCYLDWLASRTVPDPTDNAAAATQATTEAALSKEKAEDQIGPTEGSDPNLGIDHVFEVFSQTNEPDEAEIVEIFAKSTANFLMINAPSKDDRICADMFRTLEKMCITHEGSHGLPYRLMEGGGVLITRMTQSGRSSEADTVIANLERIATQYGKSDRELSQRLENARMGVIDGLIVAGRLSEALDRLRGLSARIGDVLGGSHETLRHLVAIIVNLAASFLQTEDVERYRELTDLLFDIGSQGYRDHQYFVLGLLTLRRNEVVIRLKRGDQSGAGLALGEMADQLSRSAGPEAASVCVSACITYCYEAEIPAQALSNVVQIGCRVLEHALQATDTRGWLNVFQQIQELAVRLKDRYPAQAAAILRAYKKLALARFAQGRKVAADIDRVLEKLGE